MNNIERILEIVYDMGLKDGFLKNSEKEALNELFNADESVKAIIAKKADLKCRESHNNRLYVRGVIELSNICKNRCKYCSMSADNKKLHRYKIPREEVIEIILDWAEKGIKVFHLSSGEQDGYSVDDLNKILNVIHNLKCRAIIVLGKKNNTELRKMINYCPDITLIEKFETSNPWLYHEYNNKNGGLEFRLNQLEQARKIGFKIGTGNIVGLPFQNTNMLVEDLALLKEICPDQASTSNYIPSGESEYSIYKLKKNAAENTLLFISLMRLVLPDRTIIPTNSSLGEGGKEKALRSGANLVSINLTPEKYLNDYVIYDRSRRKKGSLDDLYELAYRTDLVPEFLF